MSEQSPQKTKACCIINPSAAQYKWLKRKKVQEFLQKNLPGDVHGILGNRTDTVSLAKKLTPCHDLIVAIGGDGTIADILEGIVKAGKEKEILFGIIPLGSGNAFRKSLDIPKNIKKAIRILQEGEPREIDLIRLNDRVAGFASVGMTAAATEEKLRRPIQGFWGHVIAGLTLIAEPKREREIELFDGIDAEGKPFTHKKFNLKFLDCVVSKTSYFGYNWRIAPKAKLDDGYLDITFYEMGTVKYALLLPLIFLGIYQQLKKNFKAKKMIIRGKDLPIQYHGEFLGRKDEIVFEVVPRAIKILSPKKLG